MNDIRKEDDITNEFVFIKGLDEIGNDLYFKKNTIIENMKTALSDENCVGFNTMGYLKNKITNLVKSEYFSNNDGIFIKKKYYDDIIRMIDI
jgi:hypothetical protein